MSRPPLLQQDLAYFEEATRGLAAQFRGRRIFITGGTGFLGRWLVECLLHLDQVHALDLRLGLLTRDATAFARRSPHLAAHSALSLVEGDVRTFTMPAGHLDYLVHAAAESVVAPGTSFAEQISSIVEGTRHVLRLAAASSTKRLLFLSSGAVYGPQPRTVLHIAEDDPQQPDLSAYATGKRAAEALCVSQGAVPCVIARAFAFLGAHLPLDAHFAAGNFLKDALEGRPLVIQGDGTPLRSYMYAADLSIWLWTLLLTGAAGRSYNVGSDRPVSIRELAQRVVAVVDPGLAIELRQSPPAPGTLAPRYVPSIERARSELGLGTGIELDEAIARTAQWYRSAWAQDSLDS